MRVLAPTLLLLGARALAAPLDAPPAPVSAAVPTSGAAASGAAPAAPIAIQPAQEPAPSPARPPEPAGPPSAPPPRATEPSVAQESAPAARPPALPPVIPSQALIEKLGQGDRLFLAGDYRNALFAYQDAVYIQPRYAPSHVKLGRTYLALRYPAQAAAQAEAALAEDPDSGDAHKLLEEAQSAPARPTVASPVEAAPAAAPPPRSSPRVFIFRFTPEPDGAAPPAPGAARAPATAAAHETGSEAPDSAPQRYRAALVHLDNRDWETAASELSRAIAIDPKLAVAYAARGSAYFGSGRYREAAEDYADALLLAPELATPVYGLAECYRALGDSKRAMEMYELYAQSSSADVREDLRAVASKRAQELR